MHTPTRPGLAGGGHPAWSIKRHPADHTHPATLNLDGREIALARVWAGLVWPEEAAGHLLVAGQASGNGHAYLVHEVRAASWPELVRKVAEARRALGVSQYLDQGGELAKAYRDRGNRLAREEALTELEPWGERHALCFTDAPHQATPRFLAGLAQDWLSRKRLTILPELSLTIAELKQAQGLGPGEVAERLAELPALRAVLMILAGFDAWSLAPADSGQKLWLEPMDQVAGF